MVQYFITASDTRMEIEYFPIEIVPFNELIATKQSPDFQKVSFPSYLFMNPDKEIGIRGSWKTAHPAHLQLISPLTSSSPLGQNPDQLIVAKRAYHLETT
jgi:hypothetical protein